MCRDNGASTDDIDYRARWKVSRMQDRYTGTQLHWPNKSILLTLNFSFKLTLNFE